MLRFGLLGCGRIAKRHAKLLSAGEIPGANLAAVCDIDSSRLQDFSETYNVPGFMSLSDMVASEGLDVISVLTPSGMHADHAIQVAQLGKHVVVEKPMALRLEDADRMIHACDAAGVQLHVVKQNRFNVPVQKLREALEVGRFGRLVMGSVRVRWCRRQSYYDQDEWRGTWRMDGGVLANQASHHVDLLEWMLGDVKSVMAVSSTALVDIEAEDSAAVLLRFANDAIGIIEATTATRPVDLEGSLSVLGEKGSVVIGGFAVNEITSWAFEEPIPEDERVRSEYSVNPPDVYGFGHRAYYRHVVDCISNGSPALVDGLEGRRSLELITAIYQSIETRQEVHLRFDSDLCQLGR